MSHAEYHRATLDSVRRKLPHPERYRLVLAALLTYALANDRSPELGYQVFQWSMAVICFVAITWLLIDYASLLVRAGAVFVAFVILYGPSLDASSDLDVTKGALAFLAAAFIGGVSALIDRSTGHSDAAIHTHALRDVRKHA